MEPELINLMLENCEQESWWPKKVGNKNMQFVTATQFFNASTKTLGLFSPALSKLENLSSKVAFDVCFVLIRNFNCELHNLAKLFDPKAPTSSFSKTKFVLHKLEAPSSGLSSARLVSARRIAVFAYQVDVEANKQRTNVACVICPVRRPSSSVLSSCNPESGLSKKSASLPYRLQTE